MPATVVLLLGFGTALVAAASAVPIINRYAIRWNFLDVPDGDRHLHKTPVPRLGGVAVFFGLMAAAFLVPLVAPSIAGAAPWAQPLNRALVGSCVILFVIGLLDDLRGVRPGVKLIGQTAAAAIVISYGFRIDAISIGSASQFSLGVASIPITVLWLVGVSNAFNLIDGLDGLAGGVGIIALAAITASAAALSSTNVPFQAIALAGALIGFLKYNRAPARIFLGDSGSLVVGFVLAVLAVRGATTSSGVVYVLIPIFALSYLLLDTGIAMLRRWLRGAPLSRADGRHIHHQLLALGLTPQRAVTVIYLKSAFIAVLGLCVVFVPPQLTLAITGVGIAALLVIFVYGIRWLNYHEFLEAGASFASGMRKSRTSIQDRILARDVASILSGARSLSEINETVRGYAAAFRFVHMEVLQEDAPAAGTVRAPDHIGSATWLIEYPVYPGRSGGLARGIQSEPVLAIWCAVESATLPANAERVAQILVPAIADTLTRVGAGVQSESLESRPRRSSGAFLYSKRRVSSEHRRIDIN